MTGPHHAGERARYGRTPMFSGRLAFLSNFDTTTFHVPVLDATVCSGEHAFNALKSLDPTEQRHVLDASTPSMAKRRGRSVRLRPGWDVGGRVWAMQRVVVAKFATPPLAIALTETGDLELVETNWWCDQFWGSCFCPRHETTPGVNMLGQLLMAVRHRHAVSPPLAGHDKA